MANNFQYPNTNQNPMQNQLNQLQYQYQQLFPQPQGNVYIINSSLELANVPMSTGTSVALCFNENLCYLKTIQNGSPALLTYKLSPKDSIEEPKNEETKDALIKFSDRLDKIEAYLRKGGRLDELL